MEPLSEFKVVTYNIAGNHDTFSHENIFGVLQSLNADIICLQEVKGDDLFHTQAHSLANDLRMNCIFGQAHQSRMFGNAILSRFPLTNRQEIHLPRGSLLQDDGTRMPGQNERRLALIATVCPYKSTSEFDFLCICTHIGIYNSAEQSNEAHVPGELIGRFVNSDSNKNRSALLLGDMNCSWNNGSPFTGVVQRLDRNWNMYPTAGTITDKSESVKHKIDYICDRSRGRWQMTSMEVVRNPATMVASDHLPVVATWLPISK